MFLLSCSPAVSVTLTLHMGNYANEAMTSLCNFERLLGQLVAALLTTGGADNTAGCSALSRP